MNKFIVYIGCLLFLCGCSDHKVNDSTKKAKTDTKETSSQVSKEVNTEVQETKPQDLRDLSYTELLYLMRDVMDLATKIKGREIEMDSTYAKDTITELSSKVSEKVNQSRSDIIPKLEQSQANEYYTQFVDEVESLTTDLNNAILNGDFNAYGNTNSHVIRLKKIMSGYSEEVGI